MCISHVSCTYFVCFLRVVGGEEELRALFVDISFVFYVWSVEGWNWGHYIFCLHVSCGK